MTMNLHLRCLILDATGARDLLFVGRVQRLWGGYGSIDRYDLIDAGLPSIIVKHVRPPRQQRHPRGWSTNLSHERKLRSYHVETRWYEQRASACDEACRIPRCLAVEHHPDEIWILLDDLDAAGFPDRKTHAGLEGLESIRACLTWLAHFHARFMGTDTDGLWEVGTYWHLATRPDELAALDDADLKLEAARIDRILSAAPFQTLVHGDAKLANFCFASDGRVAAVDFQYVGGGCGMKDVAYFIGSCLDEEDCEVLEERLLAIYFNALRQALARYRVGIDAAAVEAAWRPLYRLAWTDFHRFLKGWSPKHWKLHGYSERMARAVIADLRGKT